MGVTDELTNEVTDEHTHIILLEVPTQYALRAITVLISVTIKPDKYKTDISWELKTLEGVQVHRSHDTPFWTVWI